MEEQKDKVAIIEFEMVICQLHHILEMAKKNVGSTRPIIYSGDIDLVKDHLDLVVKYSRL